MGHENLCQPKVIVQPPVPSPRLGSSSDGIQRKYRRSQRNPIPEQLENKADCSSEGCSNNHKSFNLNFSMLVECWRCNSFFSNTATNSKSNFVQCSTFQS